MPAGLRFITEAPSPIKGYREGQEYAQAERLRDQNLRTNQQQFDIREQMRPYELQTAQTAAEQAKHNLTESTAMSPYKIGQAQATADQARTAADQSAYDFGDKVRNGHFLKSVELIKTHGFQAGAQYAQQNGIPLPPNFLNNEQARAALANLEAAAQKQWPNQPENQAKAIATALKRMQEHLGELGYDPVADLYANQEGLPERPAQSFLPIRPLAPGAGSGGPFAGRTQTERMMNFLATGDPSSPEYAAAYATLAKPQVSFDPNTGEAILVSPDMSWARPPGSGSGERGNFQAPQQPKSSVSERPGVIDESGAFGSQRQPSPPPPGVINAAPQAAAGRPTITTQPGRTGSPTAATYQANLQQAQNDVAVAKQMFFPNGQFDRSMAMTAAGNVPFTQGREARQAIRRAVEIILRLRTGAAAPQQEVDNYTDQFSPSALDSDQGAATKMQRLEEFFADSARVGGQGGGSGQVDYARTPQQTGAQAGTPVRVNTPDEAMRLPPGTVFITPDGRRKVR